jgi:thiol-disulfide isomerase/thioredoxin
MDDFHLNGSNIKEYYLQIYKDYNIENWRKAHVTDQGANLKKCINELMEEYYRCGCHLIQLLKKMTQLTAQEVKEKIENKESFVLDLFATWCGPCKVLMGNLNALEKNNNDLSMPIYSLDIDFTTTVFSFTKLSVLTTFGSTNSY